MFIFTSSSTKFDDFVRSNIAICFTCFHSILSVADNKTREAKKRSNKNQREKSFQRNDSFGAIRKKKVACIASIFPHAMIMQSGERLSKSVGANVGYLVGFNVDIER